MNTLDEIKNAFSSLDEYKSIKIKSIPDQYRAYVIKLDESYGVGIEYFKDNDINEEFANAKIQTKIFNFGINNHVKMLYLNSNNLYLRNEFAVICKHFVDPGENGEFRKALIENPYEWWESWKSLLGNAERDYKSYSILAELLVLKEIYKNHKNVKWTSIYNGTHDFETNDFSCEVKSTLKKYDLSISVNSQNQLHSNKPVYLYFCRMESSNLGISIDDVVKDLILEGYPEHELERQLSIIGLQRGKKARKDKYNVRDKRKFTVDNNFPKLSIEDIEDMNVRNKIIKLVYTIDLSGLDYTEW